MCVKSIDSIFSNSLFRVYLKPNTWPYAKKTSLPTTLTKNVSKNNYKKTYFYYECNRPKRDLQNKILKVYIII